MAALAVCTDEEARVEAEEIIGYVVDDIQDVFYGFMPDGAWYEGSGYWGYMMKYYAGMIRGFMTSCGTDYGIGNNPGVNMALEFIFEIQGPGGPFNFSDAGVSFVTGGDCVFYLTEYYKNSKIFDVAEKFINNHASKTYPEQVRNTWDETVANYMGIHGGLNYDTHAQMDSGTIILDALGKRFVNDLGKDDYNISGGRLKYHNNVMGHNLLCFNPTTAGEGQIVNAGSKVIRQESNQVDSIAVLDLKDVWANYVTDYKRGIRLTDERNVFIVQDEYELTNETNELWWFIHTSADIELSEDGRSATLTKDNIQLEVKVLTDTPGEFLVMDPVPLPGSESAALENQSVIKDIKRLSFRFDEVESGTFSVAFIPMRIGMPSLYEVPEVIPISEWKLKDDSYYSKSDLATVDMIYADGQPINNFRSDVSTYEYVLPVGKTDTPQISVNNDNAIIYQAKTNGEPAYVMIGESAARNIYTINFKRDILIEKPDNIDVIPFSEITVSEEPQEANCASNLWDDNLETRWSCQGPCYTIYDIGKLETVNAVGLAWYLGQERQADFEIYVSKDGEEWKRVFSGLSTGVTESMEYYDIGAENARYVKVVGYPTSATVWVSITEFRLFGVK